MKPPVGSWIGFRAGSRLLFGLAALLASVASLYAQLTITLPNVTLQPDTPGQTFDVFVSNSGADRTDITGIGFFIQTGDGGTGTAPTISFADVVTSTIFSANNTGNQGAFNPASPQVFVQQTSTAGPGITTVTIPSGLAKIATVTIDTTGFTSGTYSMTLNTLNGPSKFTTTTTDVFPTLVNGSITISAVPEPNAAAAVGSVLLGVAGMWRWKKAGGKRQTSRSI